MAEPLKTGPKPIPEIVDEGLWKRTVSQPATQGTVQGKKVDEQSVQSAYTSEAAEPKPKKRKLSDQDVSLSSSPINYREVASRYASASATDDNELPLSFLEDFWEFNSTEHPDYGSALVFLCMDLQLNAQDIKVVEEVLVKAIERAGAAAAKVRSPKPSPTGESESDGGSNKGSDDSRPPDSSVLADKLITSLSQPLQKITAAKDLDGIVKTVFSEKGEEIVVEFMRLHYEHDLMTGIRGIDSGSEDNNSGDEVYSSEEETSSQPGTDEEDSDNSQP